MLPLTDLCYCLRCCVLQSSRPLLYRNKDKTHQSHRPVFLELPSFSRHSISLLRLQNQHLAQNKTLPLEKSSLLGRIPMSLLLRPRISHPLTADTLLHTQKAKGRCHKASSQSVEQAIWNP